MRAFSPSMFRNPGVLYSQARAADDLRQYSRHKIAEKKAHIARLSMGGLDAFLFPPNPSAFRRHHDALVLMRLCGCGYGAELSTLETSAPSPPLLPILSDPRACRPFPSVMPYGPTRVHSKQDPRGFCRFSDPFGAFGSRFGEHSGVCSEVAAVALFSG